MPRTPETNRDAFVAVRFGFKFIDVFSVTINFHTCFLLQLFADIPRNPVLPRYKQKIRMGVFHLETVVL